MTPYFVKLKDLSDDILILPAHYADIQEINSKGIVGASLGEIRKNNEIMQNENRESFTEKVEGAALEKPPNFEDIIAINLQEKHVGADKEIELEIGPNRCAVHHHG